LFLNIAAYKFVSLDDLPRRRRELWHAAQAQQLCGTILLSPEGINLFLAGTESGIEAFLERVTVEPGVGDLVVKRSWTDFQPFRRLLVKVKREIIAFGIDSIRPEKATSPKLTPEELKAWLDAGRPVTLLDTRNDYEVELGTFQQAIDLGIHHFRDFPQAAAAIPEEIKARPMVTFCTGGIRCEKAGPYLEQLGFREVYQLDGGILNYFERCGNSHYAGDCFVFDHRVAVTPELKPSGAKLCFACQAVLTADDLASEKYASGISCPHCYRSPEIQQQRCMERRRRQLRELAENLPGSQPYENRLPMYVGRAHRGWPLIDWLTENYRGHSREAWLAWIQAGQIVTGTQASTADQTVRADRQVAEGEVYVRVLCDYREPSVNAAISLIYEDRSLVVVDKPAPLPVHPSGRFCRNTLDYLLGLVYRPEKLFLAHRLDAHTTGLVLFSRRYAVAGKLQQQFRLNQVDKLYLARVVGHPPADDLECLAPIGRRTTAGGGRAVDAAGQPARTAFRVRCRFPDGTSLIECRPHTGRTHQIRLHLAHLGFPIVHDRLYPPSPAHLAPIAPEPAFPFEGPEEGEDCSAEPRQLLRLHCWKLALRHPVDGRPLEWEAPPPAWGQALA
jgi:RluA family pseudouridine synthase